MYIIHCAHCTQVRLFHHFVNMITFIGTFIYNINAEMTFSHIQVRIMLIAIKFKLLFFHLCLSLRFWWHHHNLASHNHRESFPWPFFICIHLPFVVHNKLEILNCRWIMAFGNRQEELCGLFISIAEKEQTSIGEQKTK